MKRGMKQCMKDGWVLPGLLLLLVALSGCQTTSPQRYAMVIGVKPEKLEEYKALHADPWQGVLEQIDASNLRNFSIWHVEYDTDVHLLFGYFEYVGDDFDADMAAMADSQITQKWWKVTDPCQTPIPSAKPGQQWVMMEEVFYRDKARPGASLMDPPTQVDIGDAD